MVKHGFLNGFLREIRVIRVQKRLKKHLSRYRMAPWRNLRFNFAFYTVENNEIILPQTYEKH